LWPPCSFLFLPSYLRAAAFFLSGKAWNEGSKEGGNEAAVLLLLLVAWGNLVFTDLGGGGGGGNRERGKKARSIA
jgi:hypothetical protein